MQLAVTLSLTVVLVLAALRARAVTRSGAVSGAALAVLFALMPTPAVFVTFVFFVVGGTGVSRIGLTIKEARGIAQERSGARGASHALANAGFAGLAAALFLLGIIDGVTATILGCGSLAAALSDTVSSELGQAFGGRPRHVIGWREVEWGTDGAVSTAGTAAGVGAAAAAAFLAITGGCPAMVAVMCGGVGGNLVDTLIGATLEPRLGRAGNAVVNVLGSSSGGLIALLLA